MRIENKTKYKTQCLRELFSACCRMADTNVKAKELYVHVSRANTRVSGVAFLGASVIWIKIPRKELLDSGDGKKLERIVAWVFIHELLHCDGIDHHDMNKDWYPCGWRKARKLKWADKYLLVEEVPELTPLKSCKQKLEHARKMVDRHKIRRDREETLIKKWKRKVRYYERRLDLLETKA